MCRGFRAQGLRQQLLLWHMHSGTAMENSAHLCMHANTHTQKHAHEHSHVFANMWQLRRRIARARTALACCRNTFRKLK